jgi:hypothetical protein
MTEVGLYSGPDPLASNNYWMSLLRRQNSLVKNTNQLGVVAHACNPGRDCSLRPAQTKISETLSHKNKLGMMVHICNPSYQGGSWIIVRGLPGQKYKTLCEKLKQKGIRVRLNQ